MPNPHPSAAGNAAWRAAMAQAAFKKGWTNRKRCKAIKRDGTPCGRLAMTRYGLVGMRRARRQRGWGCVDPAARQNNLERQTAKSSRARTY